jgi:uncharacterized protein YjdB
MMAVAVLTAACSDDTATEPTPSPGPKPVATVSIAPKSGVWSGTLKVGQTIELAAKPLAADGTELPPAPVDWNSTSEEVASVSGGGLLVAKAEGTTEVEATIAGKTGRLMVVVTADPPPPAQVVLVEVSPTAMVLNVGATRQYTARAYDANGQQLFGRTVTWTSRAGSVASVSTAGLVRALAPGYTDIVANIEGVSAAVGLTVATPEPVRAVIITPSTPSVYVTQYTQLRAVVIGPNGGTIERPVTWSSDNPQIAQVGINGMVLGVAKGTARIRATSEGVTGHVDVQVRSWPTAVQTYDLKGTVQLPVPYVEIGRSQWMDPSGTAREVYVVVRGGELTLDSNVGRYRQKLTVSTYIANGGPNQAPVQTVEVTDEGTISYDFPTGMPELHSTKSPGQVLRASPVGGAGEFMIPQAVLGFASQPWLWIVR